MTTLEIIEKIKVTLDDAGVFFTDEDIWDSLQDGYDELSLYTECIEKLVLPTWPTEPYWNIRETYADYFRVFAIYDPNQNKFLEPSYLKQVHIYDDKWEVTEGKPQCFIPLGFDYVAFYPHYATVPSQSMYLFYKALAPDVSSSNTLLLPVNTQNVIVDYVANDLLDQALEFTKSQLFLDQYLVGRERMRKEVEGRNSSDRIYNLLMQYGNLE